MVDQSIKVLLSHFSQTKLYCNGMLAIWPYDISLGPLPLQEYVLSPDLSKTITLITSLSTSALHLARVALRRLTSQDRRGQNSRVLEGNKEMGRSTEVNRSRS